MADERIVEESRVGTYAQPLSRLQVSWGSILAGAVTMLAVSLLLWAFALAIILSATNPSISSIKASVAAAWITSIITTLIGGLVGGAVAGYLPGNPRRLITVAHGFLAWALAFLVAVAAQSAVIGGAARTVTSAVVSTTSAAVQGAGSAVGGAAAGAAAGAPVPIDQRMVTFLESIGYSRAEAAQMVTSARADLQQVLRGRAGQEQAQRAGEQARGALDTLFNWAALYMWLWFATWAATAGLSILGASMIVDRVRRVPERERAIVVHEGREVVEVHAH
jgi:hypothetical protein